MQKVTMQPKIRQQLRRLLRHPRERRRRSSRRPRLRFSPTAWAKLLYLRDRGSTEIGGFGITPADDLLYVEDIRLVPQRCTAVSVVFDDAAVADFFDEQIDVGRRPDRVGRIWIHTHPGESAEPSFVDEETFARVFGACDWAVMFILACGGQSYCRLHFRSGPGGSFEIPVEIDFGREFAGSDLWAWEEEFAATVSHDLRGWADTATVLNGTSHAPVLKDEPIRFDAIEDWGDIDVFEPLERLEEASRHDRQPI
jgi:hypothetical protein